MFESLLKNFLENYNILIKSYPLAHTLLAVICLIIFVWLINITFKKYLIKGIKKAIAKTSYGKDKELNKQMLIIRLTNIIPVIAIMWGVKFIPGLQASVLDLINDLCNAFIIWTLAMTFGAALNITNVIYNRLPDAKNHSIKGYLQLVKIIVYIVTAILIIAVLIDRSPVILLSGLGAMAAVFMLIFQDTLLSLVASIQMSSSDMIRVGDWIEVPALNADGEVIDIALHTVKVQNWDNTITTLPTRKLITDPFKNWRGMEESGARRIKKSIYFDLNSIHHLSNKELQSLKKIKLLEGYLIEKEQEIDLWNKKFEIEKEDVMNSRRITNIGTFRAYIERYLRSHESIDQYMILLVRQKASKPEGLPIELYCFSNKTIWSEYESIQSDIFDHLFIMAPEFGLKIFQNPSGTDLHDFVNKKSIK